MDPGLVNGGVHGPGSGPRRGPWTRAWSTEGSMDHGPCFVLSPSRRSVRYKAQEVFHYLHGNFAIPDNINDFESDVEEFESGKMTMI